MRPQLCLFALATIAAVALPLPAQAPIPVRTLGAAITTDSGVLGYIGGLRVLPGGSVLVSDVGLDRVILLDATLSRFSVVLSNDEGAPNKYGRDNVGLIPYLGDSTVFVDVASSALLVISPSGRIVRSMAAPPGRDVQWLGAPTVGIPIPFVQPGFDPNGRLLYRTYRPLPWTATPATALDSGKVSISAAVDSAPILRADLDSRSGDTVAMMRIPLIKHATLALGGRGTVSTNLYNPTPSADDAVLLPDGTIALVRGADYHIDWLHMDGTMSSTPKMPFDWKPFTRAEKEHILDSVTKAVEAARAKEPPPVPGDPVFVRPPFMTVSPEELPDYYPPLRAGQVRADPEGNVWILPSTSLLSTPTAAGLVFDVVNRKGEVFERVRLPLWRNLVGIGPGGVVYMSYAPDRTQMRLERAQVIR